MNRAPKSKSGATDAGPAHDEASLRLVTQNKGADELIYERLAPVVNKLLWTFLGPDSERDDLAHDVFVRILRGASKIRDHSKLEAWAARVTMNAIKNEFRRRKFRRWFSLETSESDRDTPRYNTDFDGRELLLRTHRVLELLPTRERLPFSLQFLEQTSVEEIARVCGTSLRTTKRRLKAGRTRFLRLAAADPLLGPRLASVSQEGTDDDG